MQSDCADKLVVLWTSGDKEVATKMVFMYTLNSKRKGWWKEVCLIIWGPSSSMLVGDAELKESLKKMQEAGVEVLACKACADLYGISPELEKLGINVLYVGEPFTRFLKEGCKVITL